MNRKQRLEKVKEDYPLVTAGAEELERRMEEDPTIMMRILYDMVAEVDARDQRALGRHNPKGGRRKKVILSKDQILDRALGPAPSMEPFPEALAALMGERSQRDFGELMGASQSVVSRLLSGAMAPDLHWCERAARAGRVPPWYFREWRAWWVSGVVESMLLGHPNVSMKVVGMIGPPDVEVI